MTTTQEDDAGKDEVIGTIQVRCGLRNCLRMAAEQSITVYTIMQMGLEGLLDQLAEVGNRSTDPELRRVLHILCIIDDPAQESEVQRISRSIGGTMSEISPSPKQFNFARNWRSNFVPHLNDPAVVKALTLGLKLYDIDFKEGDPPWLCGRGQWNGQRARQGCLSWYQPWGRCHHIAPFCLALGKKLFPDLNWGFVSGELHTVVIGWNDDWNEPAWVMDILQFRRRTANESLDFVKQREWKFYDSLNSYMASFCSDPEAAFARLEEGAAEGHVVRLINRSCDERY